MKAVFTVSKKKTILKHWKHNKLSRSRWILVIQVVCSVV